MRFWMPFFDKVGAREELCRLAGSPGSNKRELCRRFKISPTTLYEWRGRYEALGLAGLEERSRRPLHSPLRTNAAMEAEVLRVREDNSAWGGRKIAANLRREGKPAPAPSTITAILRRHGKPLNGSQGQRPWKRFEHAEPNALWQMDFKGHVAMQAGRLHPLTVVDDHSRYAVILAAADNERTGTVRGALQGAFERYGLPYSILTDNGPPWGDTAENWLTQLGVWLIEHGVEPWHTAPAHPQTNGKNERFNRTLKVELLDGRIFRDLGEAQPAFDEWRHRYNHHRPHDAIGLAVPADRHMPSPRAFREAVDPFDYGPHDNVRSVDINGHVSFKSRRIKISKALFGKRIALRPNERDGVFAIVFRHVTVKHVDLTHKPV